MFNDIERAERIRKILSERERKKEDILEQKMLRREKNKNLPDVDVEKKEEKALKPKLISNSYDIKDENLCPQIKRGEDYVASLSAPLLRCIKIYTADGYRQINRSLRSDKKSVKEFVKNFDLIFKDAPPLEVSMIVYRGVSALVHDVEEDKGYVSVSTKENVANGFCRGINRKFIITLPAGTKALFVNNVSSCKGECEIILNRGSNFVKVFSYIEEKPGGVFIENIEMIYVSDLS